MNHSQFLTDFGAEGGVFHLRPLPNRKLLKVCANTPPTPHLLFTLFRSLLVMTTRFTREMYRSDTPEHILQKILLMDQHLKQIEELENRLKVLRAEYTDLEVEVRPFRIQPVQHELSNPPSHTVLAPINRCPDEVLYIIFYMSIGVCHTHIRRLLLVCKRWNSIVMDSPSLWATIKISSASYLTEETSGDYISACVSRSRDLTLDVDLSLSEFGSSDTYISSELQKRAMEITSPEDHYDITSQIIGQNWYFESPLYHHLSNQAFECLLGPNGENLARWNKLCVRFPEGGGYADVLWARLAGAVPKLTALTMEHVPVEWRDRIDWMDGGLTDLENLKSLDISIDLSLVELGISLGISANKLKYLKTVVEPEFTNFLELSSFIGLRTLRFFCSFEEQTASPVDTSHRFSLTLPHLAELELDGSYDILRQVDFDLPTLEVLKVCTTSHFFPLPRLTPKHIQWEPGAWSSRQSETASLSAAASMLLLSKAIKTFTVDPSQRISALRVVASYWAEGRIPSFKHVIICGIWGQFIERIDMAEISGVVDLMDLGPLPVLQVGGEEPLRIIN